MVSVSLPTPGAVSTRNTWGHALNAAVTQLAETAYDLGVLQVLPEALVLPTPLSTEEADEWWEPLRTALLDLGSACTALGVPTSAPIPYADPDRWWEWPEVLNAFLRDVEASLTSAESRPNLTPNPSFEVDTSGWTGNTVFGSWATGNSAETSTERATRGVRSMRINWGSEELSKPSGFVQIVEGLEPGETYLFSADLWVPTDSPHVYVDCLFHAVHERVNTDSADKGRWTRVGVRATPSATSPAFSFNTMEPRTGASDHVFVDNVRLIRASD